MSYKWINGLTRIVAYEHRTGLSCLISPPTRLLSALRQQASGVVVHYSGSLITAIITFFMSISDPILIIMTIIWRKDSCYCFSPYFCRWKDFMLKLKKKLLPLTTKILIRCVTPGRHGHLRSEVLTKIRRSKNLNPKPMFPATMIFSRVSENE